MIKTNEYGGYIPDLMKELSVYLNTPMELQLREDNK